MDKKTAAGAPAGQQGGGKCGRSAGMSRAEAVRFWEALFDEDAELAGELFWDTLLRDARAEYDRKGNDDDEEEEEEEEEVVEEEDRRLARVFKPWHPPAPAGSVPPPQPPVVAPAAERTWVLGLRAPPHLARKPEAGKRHP